MTGIFLIDRKKRFLKKIKVYVKEYAIAQIFPESPEAGKLFFLAGKERLKEAPFTA